ncbi:DUF6580 family putative transport protein [Pedobacter sp. KLB.chiD]|uniref:DUF6580 family putative transport protein n=1 Tax=Pedobacter sp. KLB.chiD TaxID=3387402 RepID=UPI00399BD625
MAHLKFNPRNLILLLMILALTAFRLLVTFNADELQFANFSSIGAVALFGGAYFKNHLKAFAFPLLSLFLSDFVLASTIFSKYSGGSFLYEGWYWTYIAFALMVLVGRVLLKNINVVNLLASTLSIVLIHWLVTDLGVWINNPAYTQDLAGYWSCLVKAIPFEIRFLEGTVIYGALLFSAFETLKAKYPVLKLQTEEL